jgi:hypothetical protein
VGYTVGTSEITIDMNIIEVESMEIWVQEKEMKETYEKTLKENLEIKKELETLKKVEEETPNTVVKKFNFTKKVKKANFKKEDNK